MDWFDTNFANLIKTIESGSRPKGGVSTNTGEIPSLGGENILQSGGVTLQNVKRVPQKFYQTMTKGVLQDYDVLINKDGANTGKVGLFRMTEFKDACINEHLFLLRAFPHKLTQTYLYYLLLWENTQLQIKNKITGSAQPGLNSVFLKDFPVILPAEIEEQTQIANILSTLDQAINQTEAIIEKQTRIKTGLLQDLLTKGINEYGNIRSEETHEFKDSPLGRIPVEWDVNPVSVHLKHIEQGWSPDCDPDPASRGEWGVLKTTSVVWEGYFDFENKRLPVGLNPRPKLEVNPDDILMTRAGPNSRVGVIAHVSSTQPRLMLSDKLYRLIPHESMNRRFLVYSLSSFSAQKHLSTMKTGMAESQTNISQEIVKKMLTVVPNKTEQDKIVETLNLSFTAIHESVLTLFKLRKLRTGLMQDLLTSKVPVTELLKNK